MNISELVKIAKEVLEKHGDMEIRMQSTKNLEVSVPACAIAIGEGPNGDVVVLCTNLIKYEDDFVYTGDGDIHKWKVRKKG